MRRFFIMLSFCFAGLCAYAQVFPVDTLIKNGSVNNRLNMVFMGDGYTATEQSAFTSKVATFNAGIFTQSPYKEYKNYFNIFAINVVSQQSGVNHPRTTTDSDCASVPVLTANSYFGSTFDYNGIHRLLVPNFGKVFQVLSANLPLYDQAFIIVNTGYYGGSGGSYSTASTNSSAIEIAVHEIGHSFASLADEYWAGASYASERPNMTQTNNVATVKWHNWIGTNAVGLYPFAEDATWFRPHQNCKMRYLNVPFCSVCREAFVERIHDLVNPVEKFSPSNIATLPVDGTPLVFTTDLVLPIPNTLKTIWKVNSAVVANNVDHLTVPSASLNTGENKVRIEVNDTTALSRSTTHLTKHVRIVEWTARVRVVTGIEIKGDESDVKLSLFPNPVVDEVNLQYVLSRKARSKIILSDASGRKVKTVVDEEQSPGSYAFHLSANELHMNRPGVYLFNIELDGVRTIEKVIKL